MTVLGTEPKATLSKRPRPWLPKYNCRKRSDCQSVTGHFGACVVRDPETDRLRFADSHDVVGAERTTK